MQEEDLLKDFALLFRRNDLKALGRIRNLRQAKIIRQGDKLWLLVRGANKSIQMILNSLPAWKRYEVRDELLYSPGENVPEENMPEAMELPLADFLEVQLPESRMLASNFEKVKLQIIPSIEQKSSKAILCELKEFENFCSHTLAIRYVGLQYIVNGKMALVKGELLPPIKGALFYLDDTVLVPCGFSIHPKLSKSLTQSLFSEGLYLWEKDSSAPVKLPEFEDVSLSSLKMTIEALNE